MTKSNAERALADLLLAMPAAQGVLGEGALPGITQPQLPPIVRTGKRGRPKGRPNNKTLMARALAAHAGDRLLSEANRLAECEPVIEAKRWVALKHNLKPTWDRDLLEKRPCEACNATGRPLAGEGKCSECGGCGDVNRRLLAFYNAESDYFLDKIVALKKGALPTGLDFQKQKPAKMVDVTERKLVVAKVTVASAEQLPAGARHLVEGAAAAVEAAANAVREEAESS